MAEDRKKIFPGIGIFFGEVCLIISLLILGAYICGIRPYIVMSGSMEPVIQTGSLCFVDTNAVYDQVKAGEIIAFRQENGMVTHRVITVLKEGLETKGDANERTDGITTTEENFCGKTLFALPYVGYLLHLLQQKWMRWGLMAGFSVWLIYKIMEDRPLT